MTRPQAIFRFSLLAFVMLAAPVSAATNVPFLAHQAVYDLSL